MLCGECKYTDGLIYLSDPPKVKCTITGEFHYNDFECNCEFNSPPLDKREIVRERAEEAVDVDLEKFRDTLNDHSFIGTLAPVEYCTSCLVCGESIPVSVYENHVKICKDCKKAILYIKDKFKEELRDY